MSISVTPIRPAIAVESAAPDLLLQPGSVVDAQVLKILSDNLVRITISNVSIDVLSEVPLAVGQTLQLAVSQTEGGIRLAVVGQGAASVTTADTAAPAASSRVVDAPSNASPPTAPSSNLLTPLERVAVSAAVENAAIQQESLAPLFANLAAVAGASNFPAKLQQAITQVLEQRTSFDTALNGSDVKNAFQKSGLFLEASLASGSVSSGSGIPDLKAALIVLRQTLVSTVNSAATAEPAAPPTAVAPQPAVPGATDPSATALALRSAAGIPTLVPAISPEVELQELLVPRARVQLADDALPPGSTAELLVSATPAKAGPRTPASEAALKLLVEMLQPMARVTGAASALTPQNGRGDDVTFHTNTPPPPFRGALPSAQPVAASSITPNAPLATSVHHLLGETEAAIARQTLLQVASLPDRADTPAARTDPVTPRWNFEIPFATAQGTAIAQFEISRDADGNEVEAARRVWRARFSLDVEPAGPVHALVSLSGERTSVRIWAERPATAAQLRADAGQLTQALGKAELQPGEIVIREGTPPAQPPARAGHFLDRAL
jgi:hypothetical protein